MSMKNLAKLINQVSQDQPPEQEFLRILNEAIQRKHDAERRQPSRTYKPSKLGGCMRELYFEVKGTPTDKGKKKDPNLIGMGESGTDRHERLQKIISEMKGLGYDVEWIDVEDFLKVHPVTGTRVIERQGMETKLRNDVLNLSFKCDGIIKFKSKYYVLEIKTETSFKWNPRIAPEEKAVDQASSYSVAFNVNRVMFVYENRDTCAKKVYVVEVTEQDKYDRVIHKIETCNTHVDLNEPPPKSTNAKDCRYCEYTEICKLT